ncbi:MAG: DUF5067 domain-containing protein [[Ruminococcus] gnavus]|nr:DUF5067 domain-containing protein [Mediterraneibacter gnavus]
MKKKIVAMLLTGAMVLSITACGGDTDSGKDNKTNTETATDQNETKTEDAQPVDDGIIDFTAEKFNVKYVRHEFTNDYEGNKCLLYYYTFTNNSDENATAGIAANVQCFQDGSECEMGIMAEQNDSMNNYALNEVQPGGTVEVCQVYKLKSDTELTIEASDMISFDNKKDTQKIAVQ